MATKKPDLRLVGSTTAKSSDLHAPPPSLGEAGRDLWRRIVTDYRIDDAGGIEMLAQACAAADRAETCAEHIRAEGEIVNTRSGPREHPLLKTELANRAFAVRTLHRLGLDVEPIRPM